MKVKELAYRPKRIFEALKWLKSHNHLYKNITLKFPHYWNIDNYNENDELFLNNNSFEIDKNEEDVIFGTNNMNQQSANDFSDESSEEKNSEDNDFVNNYESDDCKSVKIINYMNSTGYYY